MPGTASTLSKALPLGAVGCISATASVVRPPLCALADDGAAAVLKALGVAGFGMPGYPKG